MPLPPKHLPRIRSKTIVGTARKMMATQSGKKVSDTAFTKFLKKDKDLKKYAYLGKSTTVKKHEAQKLIGKVMEKASGHEKFKLSHFAKKMGMKAGPQGKVSSIRLNKAYQQASQEELKETETTKEPSKQELKQQKRREEMLKSMHKRERADEIRGEQKKQGEAQKDSPQRTQTSVQFGAGATASQAAVGSGGAIQNSTGSQTAPPSSPSDDHLSPLTKIVILPFKNQSPGIQKLDWLIKELQKSATRAIKSLKLFTVIEQTEIDSMLEKQKPQNSSLPHNELMKLIASKLSVSNIITGEIQKTDERIYIKIQLFNTISNTNLPIAEINEETEDIFDLERNINWQIINYFETKQKGGKSSIDIDIPSSSEAKDLPI